MRPLYSFFWVFSILLLKIHSHGGQGFLTKLKEINWRAITRSIKQDDRPEKIRPQVLISTTSWKGRMGSQFGLFTTCRKRLQKAQLFWEEYNNEYPGKEINTSLVTSINCILLSNKTSWHHKVQDLFETGRRYINRAVDDQIVIFQCLRNIVDFYEVPWNIVEAVQNEIFIAVCYEKTPGWYSSQAWRRELDLTIKHYDSKLIDKDQINKPRKDFRHLLALQKGVSWEDCE
ncbi:hypothetical protein DFH28DRAFT_390896 [Melampsora americana]|nr:hypothetical protein DFH28DRAFT_390896 [Melampsora americana]